MFNRKGVSPVIATVLLVLIALALAAIIFLWGKSFITEKVVKFSEPIEFSCGDIVFDAEAVVSEGKVHVVNRGNVPLYGIEVRKKGFGSVENVGVFDSQSVTVGDTGSIDVPALKNGKIKSGDTIVVVPIVLGESGDVKKSYVCSDVGVETTVI
ncbi:hypothetical protein CMI48_03380 [Candidatus Pacearchaeota archaeon]|nr:hypothetical protein [Candidatus Pacearchaeota archaeon]